MFVKHTRKGLLKQVQKGKRQQKVTRALNKNSIKHKATRVLNKSTIKRFYILTQSQTKTVIFNTSTDYISERQI